jgi:hypothetical protein
VNPLIIQEFGRWFITLINMAAHGSNDWRCHNCKFC